METIHLFVTSRKDPVPDLDSFEDYHEIKKWEKEVRPHALKYMRFNGVDAQLVDALKGVDIVECYAVVLYSQGSVIEADNFASNRLLGFLQENQTTLSWKLQETGRSAGRSPWDNFTYSLLQDPELRDGDFEVYLEVVSSG